MSWLGQRAQCCDVLNGGAPCAAHRERERVQRVEWWQLRSLASSDLEDDADLIGMGDAKLWPKRDAPERGAA